MQSFLTQLVQCHIMLRVLRIVAQRMWVERGYCEIQCSSVIEIGCRRKPTV
jgi:hypothetical protein